MNKIDEFLKNALSQKASDLHFVKLPNLEAENPDREVREVAEKIRAHKVTLPRASESPALEGSQGGA